ncbi:MAG: A/G-specific adenine glycosylase [Desulfuromonadales bacterium]|nr:A/G-specific adenine glycosylase [Desulfuromonadales bacterium]
MNLPFDPAEVSRRLLVWYGKEGRDLPWRNTRDPYRIWLSEIMLQQTTVAAVIPYYKRFLTQFPTLDALTAASLDDVITLWAGLGYYSRARNLHKTACQIVSEQGGLFPDNLDSLMALPGIGRSTAGAILSIAFDKSAPILDGNVRRVLVRLFAWLEDPRSSQAEKQLWLWAEALTPEEKPHDYAQAIMDLGATVCTPRDPDCDNCPLHALCLANKRGLATELPVARRQKKVPVRQQVALIISAADGLLLRQRPPEGFLGGLWEFPMIDLPPRLKADQVAARLLSELCLHGSLEKVGEIRHVYSHFKLELSVFMVNTVIAECVAEGSKYCWCSDVELESLPLHGAHRKAYNQFGNNR